MADVRFEADRQLTSPYPSREHECPPHDRYTSKAGPSSPLFVGEPPPTVGMAGLTPQVGIVHMPPHMARVARPIDCGFGRPCAA